MPDPVVLEQIDVRVTVTLSASLTLGLYAGPITKAVVAENLKELVDACGPNMLADMIEFRLEDVFVNDEGMIR